MEDARVQGFEFSLINEYFTELERQGPGSAEETLRALSFVDLPSLTRIADLGCGTGAQTMVLAQYTDASITALDLYAGSIDKLNSEVAKRCLQNRVKGIVGSMGELPFEDEELDLIWSEGAISNIGFEKGLRYWRRFLRKGGYVAVTYESWFTEERPAEIEKWWMDAVPEISTIARNVSLMQKAGYVPVATFTLPESCWTDNYFAPQEARREEFLQQHAGEKAVEDMMSFMKREADLYERHKEHYGYAFYIGKKL
ncbi:SAM-dependent methyltransferase [Gordonibacter sp. An230]|uniref:class I SAM-dependent methyltransferase n=1 Tax=Gordonibacter sp. An230 TaxID=1965592 RepID=UPI000B394BF9|nr:class I SAM-dependent methyltransferase [Gordonibacter sp. An230]OUO87013.1 SAM-dependent methyltransferase [Gordonibacter sp. An230]